MILFTLDEGVSFKLKNRLGIKKWLTQIANLEGKKAGDLSYIFVSDNQLLEINKEHLNHDYYTDVITFDYSNHLCISGDVFISVDRVKDNAKSLKNNEIDELHRVMAHGVLHLCGLGDKSEDERRTMRAKEDYYLSLREFLD